MVLTLTKGQGIVLFLVQDMILNCHTYLYFPGEPGAEVSGEKSKPKWPKKNLPIECERRATNQPDAQCTCLQQFRLVANSISLAPSLWELFVDDFRKLGSATPRWCASVFFHFLAKRCTRVSPLRLASCSCLALKWPTMQGQRLMKRDTSGEISSLFSGNESMMLIDVTDLFLMTSCWALSNTCHLGGQKMGEKIKSYVRFSCQQNSNTAYNIWIGNASDSEIQSHQFTIPLDESRADQRSKQRLSCRERVAVRSSINTKPPRTILYYTVSIFLSKIRCF